MTNMKGCISCKGRRVHDMKKEKLFSIRFVWLILLLSFFLLSACGKREQQGQQERTTAEALHLVVESVQETDFSALYQVLFDGESLWGLSADRSEDVYRFRTNEDFGQRVPWREGEEKAVCLSLDWAGNLYLFTGGDGSISHRVMTPQGNWEMKGILDCGEELAEQARLLCEDAEGNLYLATEDTVHLYDSEGREVRVFEFLERVESLQPLEDGNVECVTLSNSRLGLYQLGYSSNRPELLWEETFSGGVKLLATDETIWILLQEGQGSLCSIDRADGTILAEQSMENVAVSFHSVIGGWFDGETGGYLCEQRSDGGMNLYRLVEREAGEETRTELVYGTTFLTDGVKERIINFNNTNPDYYVTIRTYNDSSRLNVELISGKGPDILDTSSEWNYAVYAKQGILEDLTLYLESQGDDFLRSIYSPYTINDGIYMLIPHFTVSMLLLDAQDAPDMKEWNMDTFFRLAEDYAGEKDIFSSGDKESLFMYCLVGMWEQFVDVENGKADFDNETFIELLEFADRYGDVNSKDRNGMQEDFIGEYLFYGSAPRSPLNLLSDLRLYEETEVLGYPVTDGETFSVGICRDAIAITAASPNKEGAWEFLQTFLEEDYQTNVIANQSNYIWGWPVYKNMIEESLLESREETFSSHGRVLDALTDEEIAQFLEIVQDADHLSTRYGIIPVDIENIVIEEVQAYFSGGMSAEMVAGNIQNRVQLVLDEQ